jgi:hypothetical protein
MKVTEVMTSTPVGCAPATTLALAAQLMFEGGLRRVAGRQR